MSLFETLYAVYSANLRYGTYKPAAKQHQKGDNYWLRNLHDENADESSKLFVLMCRRIRRTQTSIKVLAQPKQEPKHSRSKTDRLITVSRLQSGCSIVFVKRLSVLNQQISFQKS